MQNVNLICDQCTLGPVSTSYTLQKHIKCTFTHPHNTYESCYWLIAELCVCVGCVCSVMGFYISEEIYLMVGKLFSLMRLVGH